MLQPVVRRTWAPKGQTPVLDNWVRRDRFSVISALALSPKRHKPSLFFAIYSRNINADLAQAFAAHLLREFPKGIILVWDRWAVHRSAARRLRERFGQRVEIVWLPPYAPQLNPVEYVWSHCKYGKLANFLPDDRHHLRRRVYSALARTQKEIKLLRSFFHHAKLQL